jgi:PRTRC genetic system protein A
VLGGDGLFITAASPVLRARIPVASVAIRGLPSLYASVELCRGRLPHLLWEHLIAEILAHTEREVFQAVRHDGISYQLVRTAQVAGPVRVRYRPVAGAVMELHSHGHYPARFSAVDDADEQGFRIYGVVGRLGTAWPEVALRVGLYGHFLPLTWEAVFAGDIGVFRDRVVDAERAAEDDDALSD